MENMVSAIFTTIGEVLTNYAGLLPALFVDIVEIFYVAESGLTMMGVLLLIGIGFGIVKWAFNLVKGLIRI